jgi:hypothetical protein
MKKIGSFIFAAVLVLAPLAAAAPAQERPGTPQLKTEMVRLKYITAEQVRNLMRPYQTSYGQIAATPGDAKLVVISDMPENFERVLAAIREIDVKPADLVFTVQLALGSETGEPETDEALKNDKVIAELRSLLRYRSFTLLDQNIVRTLDQKDAEILVGKGPQFVIGFRNPKLIRDGANSLIETGLVLLRLEATVPQGEGKPARSGSTTLVQTSLSMKSGEKTVVGVSRLNGGDKALVLIITGKVLD